jgi:hypothetical protein
VINKSNGFSTSVKRFPGKASPAQELQGVLDLDYYHSEIISRKGFTSSGIGGGFFRTISGIGRVSVELYQELGGFL